MRLHCHLHTEFLHISAALHLAYKHASKIQTIKSFLRPMPYRLVQKRNFILDKTKQVPIAI